MTNPRLRDEDERRVEKYERANDHYQPESGGHLEIDEDESQPKREHKGPGRRENHPPSLVEHLETPDLQGAGGRDRVEGLDDAGRYGCARGHSNDAPV
jgi:hypothetical protein